LKASLALATTTKRKRERGRENRIISKNENIIDTIDD
jgi:hypothetical protein